MGRIFQAIMSVSLIAVAMILLLPATTSAEPLKLAKSTWVGYGPAYIALEKGFFEEEGVRVEIESIEDTRLRFAALIAGRVDIIGVTIDSVLPFLKDDVELQAFAGLDDSKGADGIIALDEIKTIADLKGRKVAFPEGGASQFFLNVLLSQAGLAESDLNPVYMTAGDAGSAFVAGKVDAAVTWEPWLTRGKEAEHGHVLIDTAQTPGLISDVMVAEKGNLIERRVEFEAFLRAWDRAVGFWHENPEEAVQIMAKGIGGWLDDPKVLMEVLEGIAFYDADMNAAFFGSADNPGPFYQITEEAIRISAQLGRTEREVKPEEVIRYDFVQGQ